MNTYIIASVAFGLGCIGTYTAQVHIADTREAAREAAREAKQQEIGSRFFHFEPQKTRGNRTFSVVKPERKKE